MLSICLHFKKRLCRQMYPSNLAPVYSNCTHSDFNATRFVNRAWRNNNRVKSRSSYHHILSQFSPFSFCKMTFKTWGERNLRICDRVEVRVWGTSWWILVLNSMYIYMFQYMVDKRFSNILSWYKTSGFWYLLVFYLVSWVLTREDWILRGPRSSSLGPTKPLPSRPHQWYSVS